MSSNRISSLKVEPVNRPPSPPPSELSSVSYSNCSTPSSDDEVLFISEIRVKTEVTDEPDKNRAKKLRFDAAVQKIVDEAMEFIEPDKSGLSKRPFTFEIHRMISKRRFKKTLATEGFFHTKMHNLDILLAWDNVRNDPVQRDAYHRLTEIYEQKRQDALKNLQKKQKRI